MCLSLFIGLFETINISIGRWVVFFLKYAFILRDNFLEPLKVKLILKH